MKMKKLELLMLAIILAPVIPILYFWSDFPEPFPVHFNLHGEADGYGSKEVGLFLVIGINLVLYFFLRVIPKIDPSGKNYELFDSSYRAIRMSVHAFLSFIPVFVMLFALGYPIRSILFIQYSVLLLLLIFGNYMSTIRPNYFIGIRTPWTLSSDEVWKKTHRLAAKIWVTTSLIAMVLVPFFRQAMFIAAVIMGLVPAIYSWVEFRKEKALKENKSL